VGKKRNLQVSKESHMTVLDANYILRYLLNDNEKMFSIARETIENSPCFVLNEVLAEVVYVLTGHYKISRKETSHALEMLCTLETLKLYETKTIIFKALHLFASTSLDYVDCYLCAVGSKYEIATFDRKLKKCIETTQ